MRHFSLLLLVCAAVGTAVAVVGQIALPAPLANHQKALLEAGGFKATLTVQPIGGAPSTVNVVYSKPASYKVETPDGFTVCDGQNVTVYDKATNTYTVEPVSPANLGKAATRTEAWAWSPFFLKEPYKNLEAAKAGAKRQLRGHKVTEVTVGWKEGQATLYIDDQTGVAYGFSIKQGEKETLVFADTSALTKDAPEASLFAFTAPAGAKKVEAAAPPTSGYAAVQAIFTKNCMPCHSASTHSSGVNLSSYDGVMGSNVITPGDAEGSRLYMAIAGPAASMPKNRSRLGQADLKTINDWIKDGAKGPQ